MVEAIKYRDKLKLLLCEKNNVKLIIIPQLFKLVKLKDFKTFLKKQFIDNNIIIPTNFDMIEIDINDCYIR